MQDSSIIKYYNDNANELIDRYESVSFNEVHSSIIQFLPLPPCEVLDIGSGSGRDSIWFAENGYTVTAIEPAHRLLNFAKNKFPVGINWIDDSLPKLKKLRTEQQFDLVFLSAVLMHLKIEEVDATFKKISSLLKDDGVLYCSVKFSCACNSSSNWGLAELKSVIASNNFTICKEVIEQDIYKRSEYKWVKLLVHKKNIRHSLCLEN